MKQFKKLLVATDTRLAKHFVVDEGARIARQNQSALTIVDVVPEASWIANLVTSDLKTMRELYLRTAEEKLQMLAAPLRSEGLEVETKVLSGKTSVEVVREVLREKHDLVMAVAKGKNSKRKSFFGYTAMGLLRNCPSAVWLMPQEPNSQIKHVLGCVDVSSDQRIDAELNDKIMETAAAISQLHQARLSVLHAWRMPNEALLNSRLSPDDVAAYVREHGAWIAVQFDKLLQKHGTSIESEDANLCEDRPATAIAEFTAAQAVDLVVMGTLARAGLAGILLGNTAEQILDFIECSVLALKPYDFKSSIKLK